MKKKKKKGNMILESIVALMILMIASMMALTSTVAVTKSKVRREYYEELNRVSYCIMNEIKYNYSYDDIKNEIMGTNVSNVDGEYLGFKYTNNILDNLLTKNLLELERGDNIKIQVISSEREDKIVKMKININVVTGGGTVSIEREFNKSWWMYT